MFKYLTNFLPDRIDDIRAALEMINYEDSAKFIVFAEPMPQNDCDDYNFELAREHGYYSIAALPETPDETIRLFWKAYLGDIYEGSGLDR